MRDAAGRDRNFRSFLLAIRERPGWKYQLVALCAFTAALTLDRGLIEGVVAIGVGVVVGIAVGYPVYRRTGRVF